MNIWHTSLLFGAASPEPNASVDTCMPQPPSTPGRFSLWMAKAMWQQISTGSIWATHEIAMGVGYASTI